MGSPDAWLENLLRRLIETTREIDYSSIQALGFSFDEVCDYLGVDFAFHGSLTDQWSDDWAHRACASQRCPARQLLILSG
jgi:hypothetical protein